MANLTPNHAQPRVMRGAQRRPVEPVDPDLDDTRADSWRLAVDVMPAEDRRFGVGEYVAGLIVAWCVGAVAGMFALAVIGGTL